MSRQAAISVGLVCWLIQACATPTAPPTVSVAVAEPPCKVNFPPRPIFPADALTGDEDLWTIGTALWADRLARKAYELQLETAIEGCRKPEQ